MDDPRGLPFPIAWRNYLHARLNPLVSYPPPDRRNLGNILLRNFDCDRQRRGRFPAISRFFQVDDRAAGITFDHDRRFALTQKPGHRGIDRASGFKQFNFHPQSAREVDHFAQVWMAHRLAVHENTSPRALLTGAIEQLADFLQRKRRLRIGGASGASAYADGKIEFDGQQSLSRNASGDLVRIETQAVNSN